MAAAPSFAPEPGPRPPNRSARRPRSDQPFHRSPRSRRMPADRVRACAISDRDYPLTELPEVTVAGFGRRPRQGSRGDQCSRRQGHRTLERAQPHRRDFRQRAERQRQPRRGRRVQPGGSGLRLSASAANLQDDAVRGSSKRTSVGSFKSVARREALGALGNSMRPTAARAKKLSPENQQLRRRFLAERLASSKVAHSRSEHANRWRSAG